jgi:Macrocin-O-methyltransferase (TylF)
LDTVLHLEGNIIECGSARCGTIIIIASYLRSRGIATKKIYALDLFGGGFDITELEKERNLGLTQVSNKSMTYNSFEYVKKKIGKLGLSDTIIPIKGLFRDTLPGINSKFCLALIDCDLKESTAFCANRTWPNLSKDGVMLFDDYTSEEFKGVRPTVDDFVSEYIGEISEHRLLNRLYYVRKT